MQVICEPLVSMSTASISQPWMCSLMNRSISSSSGSVQISHSGRLTSGNSFSRLILVKSAIADLTKINREKEFPDVRRPECEIWTEPELEDIERFIKEHIHGCEILAVDIETSGSQITCIGFAPRVNLALVIPIHDFRGASGSYWPSAEAERQCWELIHGVLEDRSVRKVFQNGLYDVAFLWRAYGIRTFSATEDTMLLHHALQPESLKSLGYLGSIYTDHGPWKSERHKTDTIKRDE